MKLSLVLALLVLTGPVHALSCMRPDVATSYARFAASDDLYVVLYGRFDFDEGALPQPPRHNPNLTEPNNLISANFKGHSLSRDGFKTPFQTTLTLNAKCFGPWCAGMAANSPVMAFVRKDAEGYTLAINPCGGVAFAEPNPEMLQQAQACMQGKTCAPKDGLR